MWHIVFENSVSRLPFLLWTVLLKGAREFLELRAKLLDGTWARTACTFGPFPTPKWHTEWCLSITEVSFPPPRPDRQASKTAKEKEFQFLVTVSRFASRRRCYFRCSFCWKDHLIVSPISIMSTGTRVKTNFRKGKQGGKRTYAPTTAELNEAVEDYLHQVSMYIALWLLWDTGIGLSHYQCHYIIIQHTHVKIPQ